LLETKRQAVWAQDNVADAIVVLGPYYINGAPEEGVVEYFNEIAECVKVPLILYNFSKHTGNAITAEMLGQIDHFGMKDSDRQLELAKHTPHYYVGGDKVIVETYRAGGCGFVSGRVNFLPEVYVEMEKALKSGDYDSAERLQVKITEISEAISGANAIAMFKQGVSVRVEGYPSRVRVPLKGLSVAAANEVEGLVKSFL
jgi:4-hydroxy-tetrahydrodipicolinate synthase